jgi:hypothetical protein
MINFGAKSKTHLGPIIKIHCPHCHKRDVDAYFGVVNETTTVAFIPVEEVEYELVKCSSCGTRFETKSDFSEILKMTSDEIELQKILKYPFDFVSFSIAVIALLFGVFPVIGPVFALLAILLNRKSRRWIRYFAWSSLVVSLIINVVFFLKQGSE